MVASDGCVAPSQRAHTGPSGCRHTKPVALCCHIILLHHPFGSALGCFGVTPTGPRAVGATQQQPPNKPNGAMPQHDGAARHWLLDRWECVPSLPPDLSSGSVSVGRCRVVAGRRVARLSPASRPPPAAPSTWRSRTEAFTYPALRASTRTTLRASTCVHRFLACSNLSESKNECHTQGGGRQLGRRFQFRLCGFGGCKGSPTLQKGFL